MSETIRLLDKTHIPSEQEINAFVGSESVRRIQIIEKFLNENYELKKDLRFPFGNNYGWAYRFNDKAKHLCYLFFEKNSFTVMLQIGDKMVPTIECKLDSMLAETKKFWDSRYPCGEQGGWIRYKVLSDAEISDVIDLIKIKCKPSRENKSVK